MDMSAVRDAIADAARVVVLPESLPRLTASGFVPDAVVVPCFFTADYTIDYDRAMNRGLDRVELTCQVLVSIADDQAAQRLLDALLSGSGPSSLKAAIEAARGEPGEYALGGLAHDLHVTRMQGYRWYEHRGATYLGGQLIVDIIGEG